MKHATTHLCAAILLMAFSGPAFAESYLCIPDKATGFAFQDGEWASTDFNVGDEKFILRERSNEEIENAKEAMEPAMEFVKELAKTIESDSGDLGQGSDEAAAYYLSSTHVVLPHGVDDFPLYHCRYVPVTGSFLCNSDTRGKLLFSTKSGRFTMTRLVGYWRGKDNDQTPVMYIGRCSKI